KKKKKGETRFYELLNNYKVKMLVMDGNGKLPIELATMSVKASCKESKDDDKTDEKPSCGFELFLQLYALCPSNDRSLIGGAVASSCPYHSIHDDLLSTSPLPSPPPASHSKFASASNAQKQCPFAQLAKQHAPEITNDAKCPFQSLASKSNDHALSSQVDDQSSVTVDEQSQIDTGCLLINCIHFYVFLFFYFYFLFSFFYIFIVGIDWYLVAFSLVFQTFLNVRFGIESFCNCENKRKLYFVILSIDILNTELKLIYKYIFLRMNFSSIKKKKNITSI
ncbi:hypothetical protein RFI_19836, partial [Reticulomyxa filosa]